MPRKRKRKGTPAGPHADKYGARPRLAPPRQSADEGPAEPTLVFKCLSCRYVGDAGAMDRHRARKGHWERTVTDREALAGQRYRCKCGFVGGHDEMQEHLFTSNRVGGLHEFTKNFEAVDKKRER
jgi:hypothetical protein